MMMRFWAVRDGLNICKLGKLINRGHETHIGFRYGMVLAKEKNDDRALQFFIRSVHKYTMNWGCWLEMTSLISRVEDVSSKFNFLKLN